MIEEAIRLADTGADLPKDSRRILRYKNSAPRQFGLKALNKGNLQEALFHFNKGIDWAPEDSEELAYNYQLKGKVLFEFGRNEEALVLLKKAKTFFENNDDYADPTSMRLNLKNTNELIQKIESSEHSQVSSLPPPQTKKTSPLPAKSEVVLHEPSTQTADEVCDNVFFIVEEMPEFEGGEEGLRESVQIEYPEELQGTGKQGKVYVKFVIGPEGQVMDAEIARGSEEIFNQLALDRVRRLRFLRGGRQNGKPVCVSYTIPVSFKE